MTRPALRLILAMVLLGFAAPVVGQEEEQEEPAPVERAAREIIAPAAPVFGEVELKVLQLGVGGAAREGSWAACLVEVSDSATSPREVIVRLAIRDPDGDRVYYEQPVTTNPGKKQPVRLYYWVPPGVGGEAMVFSALESRDSAAGAGTGGTAASIGRLLGQTIFSPSPPNASVFGPHVSFIGVVGRSHALLAQYETARLSNDGDAPKGHELTQVLTGITPAMLPDRWMGLAPFEVVVWTGSDADEQPTALTQGQAGALREYVRRGGHLVVVLPRVLQNWVGVSGAASGPLADIMPSVRVTRREGVDLERYRPLFTRDRDGVLPRSAVVYTLEPDTERASTVYDAMPILAGPDGETVVVRRLLDHGAVTVIGLDLTSTALLQGGTARADQFWHRVLGRRYALDRPDILSAQARSGTLASAGRTPAPMDDCIRPIINREGKAAGGLLLAILVFGLYWVIAGFGGYYFLVRRGARQHAWLAFVAAIGLFTAISWGGANVLRVRSVQGQHLTFLDHVYGQSHQRARSWAQVFLPGYGNETIAVRSDVPGQVLRNSIVAWEPSDQFAGVSLRAFPDARGYRVAASDAGAITVPSRATVKQVMVDWLGATGSSWGMIRPVPDSTTPAAMQALGAAADSMRFGDEIRIVPGRPFQGVERRFWIAGDLVHGLPGPLRQVRFILVERQTDLRRRADDLIAQTLTGARDIWAPGDVLDLDAVIAVDRTASSSLDALLSNVLTSQTASQWTQGAAPSAAWSLEKEMVGITFFNAFPAPEYQSMQTARQGVAKRSAGHGLDLSRWLSQPCLIVIGYLEDSPLPLQMTVGGEDARERLSGGRVVVRWVFPLPSAPPPFPATAESPPEPGPGSATPRAEDPAG